MVTLGTYSFMAERAERVGEAEPVVTLECGGVPVGVLRLLVVTDDDLAHGVGQLERYVQLPCRRIYHLARDKIKACTSYSFYEKVTGRLQTELLKF